MDEGIKQGNTRLGITYSCRVDLCFIIQGLKLLQLKNPWRHRRWKVTIIGFHFTKQNKDTCDQCLLNLNSQGNFSEHDNTNWTPELRRALNFNQNKSLQIDSGNYLLIPLFFLLFSGPLHVVSPLFYHYDFNLYLPLGVFWIDWKSLQKFYDVIYINWRPDMFTHKSTLHE